MTRPGWRDEQFQQGELTGVERYHLVTTPRLPLPRVEHEVRDFKFCHRLQIPLYPAKQSMHSRQEFRKGKRFSEVIITTRPQPLDPVADATLGTQNDHRCGHPFVSHFFNDRKSIQSRKHEIHHSNRILMNQGKVEPLHPIASHVWKEPRLPETILQKIRDFGIILDDQDLHDMFSVQRYSEKFFAAGGGGGGDASETKETLSIRFLQAQAAGLPRAYASLTPL